MRPLVRRIVQIVFVIALAFFFVAPACKHTQNPPPPDQVSGGSGGPGWATSLMAIATTALGCPSEAITWTTDVGTIDASGRYTAPPCGTSWTDTTAHVTASGCSKTVTINVGVADSITAVAVYCGVIGTATCCTPPPFNIGPGATVQMYASITYTCKGVRVQGTPPAMCTAQQMQKQQKFRQVNQPKTPVWEPPKWGELPKMIVASTK